MLLCFGLSWPLNAYKGYRARTAVGTSWQFIALITAGYLAGIAAKLVSGNVSWVLGIYLVNLACLGVNWAVYLRNRRLDATGLGGLQLRGLEGGCLSGRGSARTAPHCTASQPARRSQPFPGWGAIPYNPSCRLALGRGRGRTWQIGSLRARALATGSR